jgi:hypothetical protein
MNNNLKCEKTNTKKRIKQLQVLIVLHQLKFYISMVSAGSVLMLLFIVFSDRAPIPQFFILAVASIFPIIGFLIGKYLSEESVILLQTEIAKLECIDGK